VPRLKNRVPTYRKHRHSGQAIVTLSGQDYYLGPFGTKVSRAAYDARVAEWLARGRQPLGPDNESGGSILVQLIVAYKRHAESYYRKDGKITNEVTAILNAAKVVRQLYGREPANDFDALKLQAVQQAMIRLGWCRRHINKQISRIVRMFAWGVSQKFVRGDLAHELREVKGLHRGRTEARESNPVLPIADSIVNATLPHLPPIVADMVRLQRLTGCRPAEICILRPCDMDTNGEVWSYRPSSHKTEHHGRERVIFIGPKGQDVLRPYLLRDKEAFCFCPADSERKRRTAMHVARVVPLTYGNRPGTNRSANPKRPAGKRYTVASYRRAINRACESAFGMPEALRSPQPEESQEQKAARLKAANLWREKHCWSPNQLRHSAATEIRKRFGLEAAQVTLGHAAADVTQVYAERDMQKAAEVMALVG
jgi:integrase